VLIGPPVWHSDAVTIQRSGNVAVFLNRASAAGRSPHTTRAVELARAALDADLHVADSRNADELVAWMEGHLSEYRTAIVAGGDGTLSIAYNLAAGREDVALGYIPAGFGNATAHLLNLPRDPAHLVRVLADGVTRPVDLVDANGHLALFAGAGWDAIVAERYAADGARRLIGWGTAIARSLPDLVQRTSVVVEADGVEVFHGPMELLVVSTTPWYGRGLLVNPGARADAGVLALRVYPGPLPHFGVEAARWLAKRPPSVPLRLGQQVAVRRTDGEPLIVQADGDAIGRRPEWTFAIRPAAVRLIGNW
jgi:diacylglycerol kinase (ATP)